MNDMAQQKTKKIKQLSNRVITLKETIMNTSEQSKLYRLYKKCDGLLQDRLAIGQMLPDDISFQEPLWNIRDEIIRLANNITEKLSSNR